MWQRAELAWLRLAWDGEADVELARGTTARHAPIHRDRIAAARWLPAWDAYHRACDATQASAFVTFAGARGAEVTRAQDQLRAACETIDRLVVAAGGSDLGATVVVRSPQLRTLSLARVVAVARPAALTTHQLPWDLPVGGSEADAPDLAREVQGWCLPDTRTLTIIAPRELQLERTLAASLDDLGSCESVARIVRWLFDLESALAIARRAGARVIRPAHVEDVLDALDGRHGTCLQIMGHVDRRDVLYLDGERAAPGGTGLGEHLSLRRLAGEIAALVETGWRSPVRTVDLSVCSSEGSFARTLRSCGVAYVSGRMADLHVGAVARWTRALYARRLFDGATPIAHAWLNAALGPDPRTM